MPRALMRSSLSLHDILHILLLTPPALLGAAPPPPPPPPFVPPPPGAEEMPPARDGGGSGVSDSPESSLALSLPCVLLRPNPGQCPSPRQFCERLSSKEGSSLPLPPIDGVPCMGRTPMGLPPPPSWSTLPTQQAASPHGGDEMKRWNVMLGRSWYGEPVMPGGHLTKMLVWSPD